MESLADGVQDPAVRTVEHELDIVRSAIALVASGGAPRVVLTSLRFGDQLIEPAREMVRGTRVRIVPIWTTEDSGAGISVEWATDD